MLDEQVGTHACLYKPACVPNRVYVAASEARQRQRHAAAICRAGRRILRGMASRLVRQDKREPMPRERAGRRFGFSVDNDATMGKEPKEKGFFFVQKRKAKENGRARGGG